MNRVIALNLLIPNHPIIVTASSEIVSILGPYINPKTQLDALATAFAILYVPEYTSYLLNIYTKNYVFLSLPSIFFFVFTNERFHRPFTRLKR